MNIQRLIRVPPVAVFIPFGGNGNFCTYYMMLCWRLGSSVGLSFCLGPSKFELQIH